MLALAWTGWLGRLTVLEATLHLLLYFGDYLTFDQLFSVDKYRNGTFSWLALLVILVTSVERLRRTRYARPPAAPHPPRAAACGMCMHACASAACMHV